MRFRCICLSSHRLIMDRSRKWPDLRSKMTWQTSHQLQPSLLHLHRHYSNDQCQLWQHWNAGQPEMSRIAVSAMLQVIASFWKNKIIFFYKMAPEMQRQCPQHRIRISIISPIFQLALISRSEKRPFSRYLPYWSPLAVATVTSRLQSCHEPWLPLLAPNNRVTVAVLSSAFRICGKTAACLFFRLLVCCRLSESCDLWREWACWAFFLFLL